MSPSATYLRYHYVAPESAEDDLSACLIASGALGCQVKPSDRPGCLALEAWFPAEVEPFDVGFWPGVEALSVEEVVEEDWLASYRAKSQPFKIGSFHIDPRDESDLAEESGITVLHVPAENAFGTGSHESTRLMLLWLEDLDLEGLRVLDVGSGSGILSFAAERLGAEQVVGFDLDVASVITARRNGQRNRCSPFAYAGKAVALAPRPYFDLLLVNVLPERVFGDLPRLVKALRPGGRLLSSGNLLARREELLTDFASLGLSPRGEKADGEWVSFLLEHDGS